MDRVPHELSSADQYGKDDEKKDGVDVAHAIDPVIAATGAELFE